MKLSLALLAVVFSTTLVFAVQEGDIVQAKPKHTDQVGASQKAGRHPYVVVSNPVNGQVKVASVSHNLPASYIHQDDVTNYHDQLTGQINVGMPNVVSVAHTKSHPVGTLEPGNLAALKNKIEEKCPGALTRRDGRCGTRSKPNANPKTRPKANVKKNPAVKQPASIKVKGGVARPAKRVGGVRKATPNKKPAAKQPAKKLGGVQKATPNGKPGARKA